MWFLVTLFLMADDATRTRSRSSVANPRVLFINPEINIQGC